ncbi:MAG: sulfite exporter TauE/SafE family protein [Deltaproteobacteria bacterium]|nr:sulfite exporter TauE/SafE family protein [Deltaproteobacteria bacterium]
MNRKLTPVENLVLPCQDEFDVDLLMFFGWGFLELAFITFIGGILVGVLGGLLGVGGGVFLIPFLVGVLDVAPIEAVGLSLFCVVGTSVGSAGRALKGNDINIGLGFVVEVCMVSGVVFSSIAAHRLSSTGLLRLFSLLTLSLAVLFVFRALRGSREKNSLFRTDSSSENLHWLDGECVEPSEGIVHYRPRHARWIGVLVCGSGVASGLFGIGGGMLNVPILTLVGGLPLRAAAATSSFAMALTGAAGAMIYFSQGTVPLFMVVPLLLGVIPGGSIGMSFQSQLPVKFLRLLFAFLAAVVGIWGLVRSIRGES